MILYTAMNSQEQEKLRTLVRERIPSFNGEVTIDILNNTLPYRDEDGVYSVKNHVLNITYGFVWDDMFPYLVTAPDPLGYKKIALDDYTALARHGYTTYEIKNDDGSTYSKAVVHQDVTIYVTLQGFVRLNEHLRTWHPKAE